MNLRRTKLKRKRGFRLVTNIIFSVFITLEVIVKPKEFLY
jgi:hypothetical protein